MFLVSPQATPGITEADVIRWVGVAVSVVGAFIAAPSGTWLILSEIRDIVVGALRWLRVRLAKWLPFLRKPATVRAYSGTASLGANATLSATVIREWDPAGTLEARFEVVRREIADLRQDLEEHKKQLWSALGSVETLPLGIGLGPSFELYHT